MFSGIVEELGSVARNAIAQEGRLEITAQAVLAGARVGESIAVNGCCLTVAQLTPAGFLADVMPETARRTNLGELTPGEPVNLEAAVREGERVGGHLVSGHIDAVGEVAGTRPEGNALWVTIAAPRQVAGLLVEKGCVAVDGISLTIVEAGDDRFTVSLIPHTVAATTARAWRPGSRVNLEADLVAKHVDRGLRAHLEAVEGAAHPARDGGARVAFAGVEEAVAEIAAGHLVIIVDDEDRENEGDLAVAADAITQEQVNFMLQHARGMICVATEQSRLRELDLGDMVDNNTSRHGTAFSVSVDALGEGVTTGISAHDRWVTIRHVADRRRGAADFARPGHTQPLRACPGGVLQRAGHTEAAVDLCRAAGREPAGVICEILNADGSMARRPDLERFAAAHGLRILTIDDLIAWRSRRERLVHRGAQTVLPTSWGEWRTTGYSDAFTGQVHVALVLGAVSDDDPVLVRVHSECLTGDVFGSQRCDCQAQLHKAMGMIGAAGRGVVVYLRQEGRGIGLMDKLHAYSLQDRGLDTVEANEHLGVPVDARDYGTGAQILADLGVRRIRLISNNPDKWGGLHGGGLEVVEQVPLETAPTRHNLHYLRTKRDKLGHLLGHLGDEPADAAIPADG